MKSLLGIKIILFIFALVLIIKTGKRYKGFYKIIKNDRYKYRNWVIEKNDELLTDLIISVGLVIVTIMFIIMV